MILASLRCLNVELRINSSFSIDNRLGDQSTFHIPHSSFHIPHSTFHIPHSTFLIPHLKGCGTRPLTFKCRRRPGCRHRRRRCCRHLRCHRPCCRRLGSPLLGRGWRRSPLPPHRWCWSRASPRRHCGRSR